MNEDASGWLWLLMDVRMVATLGIALAYGTMMWRRTSRNKAVQRVRDGVTRENWR